MAWVVKNNIGRSDVKVRKWAWTSEPIAAGGGEYRSDWKSWFGDLDITVEAVSGFLWEFIMNPTIVATSVSPEKETRIDLNDGGFDSRTRKYTVRVHITDNKGRDERKELDFDVKW